MKMTKKQFDESINELESVFLSEIKYYKTKRMIRLFRAVIFLSIIPIAYIFTQGIAQQILALFLIGNGIITLRNLNGIEDLNEERKHKFLEAKKDIELIFKDTILDNNESDDVW